MLNFTTCQRCGEILAVTFVGQLTHPGCESVESEKLAQEFVAAIQRGDEAEADRLEKLINQPEKSPSLGSVALWYAKRGWPVFPLRAEGSKCDGDDKCEQACQCSKKPATRHGLKDATLDLDKIKAWWSRHPKSNIGLPTGIAFDVIDIDGPTGIRSLAELGEGVLPEVHGKVSTPRGLHLYVASTGDGNRAGVRPGIDYRGKGGYVVASPSVVGGKRYTWVMRPSPAILKAP